jgi:hypothetical protein
MLVIRRNAGYFRRSWRPLRLVWSLTQPFYSQRHRPHLRPRAQIARAARQEPGFQQFTAPGAGESVRSWA